MTCDIRMLMMQCSLVHRFTSDVHFVNVRTYFCLITFRCRCSCWYWWCRCCVFLRLFNCYHPAYSDFFAALILSSMWMRVCMRGDVSHDFKFSTNEFGTYSHCVIPHTAKIAMSWAHTIHALLLMHERMWQAQHVKQPSDFLPSNSLPSYSVIFNHSTSTYVPYCSIV